MSMNFAAAITQLLCGKRVARSRMSSHGEHLYVRAINNYRPCIIMRCGDGTDQPGWTPSSDDLFAEDWSVQQ